MSIVIHNQEALQEFADLARRGGRPYLYGHGKPSEIHWAESNTVGHPVKIVPKHVYEPITAERQAEIIKALEGEPAPDYSNTVTTTGAIPTADYVGVPTAHIDFGEKRKFL